MEPLIVCIFSAISTAANIHYMIQYEKASHAAETECAKLEMATQAAKTEQTYLEIATQAAETEPAALENERKGLTESHDNCPMCMEQPSEWGGRVAPKCGHQTCMPCFIKWVGTLHNTCPICRQIYVNSDSLQD